MSRVRPLLSLGLLPLLALAALALLAPAAQAKAGEEVTFEAPRDLLNPDLREPAFTELDSLGVRALRVVLYWHDVAPAADARIKPQLDMTDPASYDWSRYQPVLDEARQRGWTVQLTVSGPVPQWATNGARDIYTRPSPNEFRQFMMAVSRHFGDAVTRWSIWNEPNHPKFLRPQYDARQRPVSPTVYRGLYAAALRGLEDAGDAKPVLMGETAPTGTSKVVAPLRFLRGALCLSETYKKNAACAKLRVDGYAHHAYTTRKGPTFVSPSKDNVMIGTLSRLTKALDKAAAAGVVAPHLPVYLTEFGIQSTPDPQYGVSFQRQNEFRALSEKIAYTNPRVAAFSQYLLTDDAPLEGTSDLQRYGGFESGLRTSSGQAKLALAGFRVPLVVQRRTASSSVSLWGLVRPAGGATQVEVQQHEKGSAWKTLRTVTTDGRGTWTSTASRGGAAREWRVRWTAPDGTVFTGPPTRAL